MFLIFLICFATGFASPQSAYERGVEALGGQDGKQATKQFVEALSQGGVHASVYHGLGNAWWLQKHELLAGVAWRRALELNPFYFPARNNLALIEHEERSFLLDGGLISWVSLNGMLVGVGGLWVMALLMVWGYGWKKGWRISLGLGVMGVLVLLITAWDFHQQNHWGVTCMDVVLQSSRSPYALEILVLPIGSRVELLAWEGSDIRIARNDIEGWVSADTVLTVNPERSVSPTCFSLEEE